MATRIARSLLCRTPRKIGVRRVILNMIVLAGLVHASPRNLSGQAVPIITQAIDSGTIVRLHRLSNGAVTVHLLAPLTQTADSAVGCPWESVRCLKYREDRLSIPMSDVGQVDLSRGTHAWQGFKIGGVVGLGVGIFATTFLDRFASGTEPRPTRPAVEVLSSIAGGMMIGTLVGALSPKWTKAP